AIGDQRIGHTRRLVRGGNHFMTICSAWKLRGADRVLLPNAGDRTGPSIVKEDSLFQFFACSVFFHNSLELFLNELFNLPPAGNVSPRSIIRVLVRQTAQEISNVLGVSMRQHQAGILPVKLKLMAELAILFV